MSFVCDRGATGKKGFLAGAAGHAVLRSGRESVFGALLVALQPLETLPDRPRWSVRAYGRE